MNKELLRDAIAVMETWWAKYPQDMSASDRAVLTRMQTEIDAPEQEPYGWMIQGVPVRVRPRAPYTTKGFAAMKIVAKPF